MDAAIPVATDAVGQAHILMLRKAMDMAVDRNAQLLASAPPPPAPPSGASGGRIDLRA